MSVLRGWGKVLGRPQGSKSLREPQTPCLLCLYPVSWLRSFRALRLCGCLLSPPSLRPQLQLKGVLLLPVSPRVYPLGTPPYLGAGFPGQLPRAFQTLNPNPLDLHMILTVLLS